MQPFKILALTCSGLALSISQAYAEDNTEAKLDKQVVTATTTAHNTITAPASVTLLTGDDLREQNHSTIAEALEETAGISLQSGAYGRQGLSIRGMEAQYSLVLIDGQRTNSANALIRGNDFDLSSFPMASVERIEVIRGPMSSLYGSDALGGVINIITKKAVAQSSEITANSVSANTPKQAFLAGVETEFTQQQEGEGGDHVRVAAYASGVLLPNKLAANVAVENSKRDAWKPFSDESAPLNNVDGLEKHNKTSAKINFDYRLNNRQNIAVNVATSKDERVADLIRRQGPNTVAHTTDQTSDRLAVSVGHTGAWDWGQSQLKLLNETIEIDDQSTIYATFDTRTNNGAAKAEQTNTVVDAIANTELSGNLISAGTQIKKTELVSDRDLPDGDDVLEMALFAQDEFFVSGIAITAGLRVDNHEDYGTHASPRIYAVYEADNGIVVKGGIGNSFRAPSLAQTSENYQILSCGGNCFLIGNPDLDPETSTASELSVAFEGNAFNISGGIFYNEVKDKLLVDQTTVAVINGVNAWQYQNIDKAIYQGAEFDASYAIASNLSISANYTYTEATDDETKENLYNVPRQQGNLKLAYQPTEKLNTFVKYRFVGTQDLNINRVREITPSYNIIDLGAQFNTYSGIKLKVGVNNIENIVLTEESDAFVDGFSYLEQGRSVYAGIGYDF